MSAAQEFFEKGVCAGVLRKTCRLPKSFLKRGFSAREVFEAVGG